jgi:hypothetical protein
MAINVTTLTNAIGASDTTFVVGSTTNITGPNFTTGVGLTYLQVEQEYMLVYSVPVAGTVTVQRGVFGSPAYAHGASAPVTIGLPTDFGQPAISIKSQQDFSWDNFSWAAPVASAATITVPGQAFHITGVASITTMNLPAGFVAGGLFYVVFDSTAAMATGGNIGVAVTGAAGKMVVMAYDPNTSKWYSTT